MRKVVHLQNHLPSSGNAAFRLHKVLTERGVHSTMLSLTKDLPTAEKINSLRLRAQAKAMANGRMHKRLVKKVNKEYGMFSYPILGSDVSNHPLVLGADIIYLHWIIGGFMNFNSIKKLAKLNKPIIVFMHDMWSMTGGCHYSFSCTNFESNCANCQMFPKAERVALPQKGFNKKQKLYGLFTNLHFIAPSNWLYELAKKSMLLKNKPIHYIANVVDTKPFKPMNQKFARQVFGLKENTKIIAFGAASPKSPYKGWQYLKGALVELSQTCGTENFSVVIFGSDHDEQIAKAIPFETHFVGRLRDEYTTALLYNAADVFVAPSLAEAFGLVILEALRCGTPVAAFNTGGIPDLVQHGKNGYLAKYKDTKDLADGIRFCIDEGLEGFASNVFDVDSIVSSHKTLHEALLDK